jgi:hypothetical protein
MKFQEGVLCTEKALARDFGARKMTPDCALGEEEQIEENNE